MSPEEQQYSLFLHKLRAASCTQSQARHQLQLEIWMLDGLLLLRKTYLHLNLRKYPIYFSLSLPFLKVERPLLVSPRVCRVDQLSSVDCYEAAADQRLFWLLLALQTEILRA